MKQQHPDFNIEKEHLAKTIIAMRQIIDELREDIDNSLAGMKQALLVKDEISAYVHTMLRGEQVGKIQDIEFAIPHPYFGRVDFREDGAEDFHSYYIGRCKVTRPHSHDLDDFLIFDWRDPIAAVFYECYAGRASYDVGGRYHYSGDVKLKRQYKIENSELLDITDSYILDQVLSRQQQALLSDPLLADRLKAGTAEKLKDIVTSIQAEQNKIIREPFQQVTVIQGVAGSGKSTIGLHRLSYLLYTEKLDPKKLLVIAPNRIFLDYISELLPEIDAADVEQTVWEDLITHMIGIPLKIAATDPLDTILAKRDKKRIQFIHDDARLKGSLDFIQIIKNHLERKTKKLCLKLEDICLFDNHLIIRAQDQLDHLMENIKAPYNERLRSLTNYVSFRVNNYVDVELARNAKKGGDEKLEKKLRSQAEEFLHSHLKRWQPTDLLKTYREIFQEKGLFKNVRDKLADWETVRLESLELLKTGQVEREDLAPLAYLSYLLNGGAKQKRYDHIVVDEAQDLTALEFAVLKLISANGSFTIMGDLSQGIYSYRSIGNWNVVLKEIFADTRTVYREILYSYRSAKEIVDLFNEVMPANHSRAIPVYEIGRHPTLEKRRPGSAGVRQILRIVQTFLARGAKSVGIITKLKEDAVAVYQKLLDFPQETPLTIPLHLIDDQESNYQGGISVLPVSLAKGLEFDSVIIYDASAASFKDDPLDSRLLYVALSRAMHDLYILYQGALTPLLNNHSDLI